MTSVIAPSDDASDYGDFGSDAEEIQILDELLAQVASGSEEEQAATLVVTDIEDYEPPRGLLLPAPLDTPACQPRPEIEATSETQILRDFEAKDSTFASLCRFCDADILTSA